MNIVVVRVLIKPPNGIFQFNGTAFFINEKSLVTAKHVLESAIEKGYEIYISDIPNGGKLLIPHNTIELCERDIAIFKTKKKFDIEPIETSHELKERCEVTIEGYHNENGARSSYTHYVSSYVNHEHTYELQGHITNGLSGSPVLLDGKVCGIAQAIHRKDNLTFIIPISELCNILDKRLEEIEKYIQNNNLSMATKRAMDFVDDFSTDKNKRHEAITLRARYVELRERLTEESTSVVHDIKLQKLRNNIVDFIYRIEEENEAKSKKEILKKKPTKENLSKHKVQTLSSFFKNKRSFFKEINKRDYIENSVFLAQDITKKYKSRSTNFILSPISFSLNYGEITVLVGENGNGKTTLLDIVAGKLLHSKGNIAYPELSKYGRNDWFSLKTEISYIEQNLPAYKGFAKDSLHYTLGLRGVTGEANADEVSFIMHRLGLEKYAYSKWSELSSGFKMRFALAKALLRKPKLLILDEPLANLDINTQQLFLNDLSDIASSLSNRMAVVLSSQNLYEVEAIADNIIFLSEGKALYNGSMKAFGNERKYNSFEFTVSSSEEELLYTLKSIAYSQIKNEGNSYILTTEKDVTSQILIMLFIEKNIEIQYFRNISKSTRKLFGEIK